MNAIFRVLFIGLFLSTQSYLDCKSDKIRSSYKLLQFDDINLAQTQFMQIDLNTIKDFINNWYDQKLSEWMAWGFLRIFGPLTWCNVFVMQIRMPFPLQASRLNVFNTPLLGRKSTSSSHVQVIQTNRTNWFNQIFRWVKLEQGPFFVLC